ncbi:MAG TPA: long-chain fatty acid--CoA ligase [Solirubrobacteraceae bacterium]|nr:long-chain fatty acid--CoA ligase [Solirubrobacteraceae bacterium]
MLPTALPPTAVPDVEPHNLGQMVLDSADHHDGIALIYREDRGPASITYPELGRRTNAIARGLIELGIEPGDRVAILALTSADWTLADYGALCAGAVVTPIYHTNSPEECAYVVAHSEARLVFCDDDEQAAKIRQIRDRCPHLEHVVLLHGAAPDAITLRELCERGAGLPPETVALRLAGVAPGDLASLVYTSGTTGPPKGCMLTHANLLATTRMYVERLQLDETHTLYQFLPLAHVLARVAQAVALSAGARIAYWSGDSTKIVDELSELAPTHFPAVPRIYEKMHGAVMGKVQDGPAPTRILFTWALRQGARGREAARAGRPLGPLGALQYRLADKLVLSKVRDLFGSELQIALVGAAPIGRELLEFFDACGVLVLEGYGLTETCAASTLNTADRVRFGSVGRPLPGTEVSVADDGELLIRGPHVFTGYYQDPAATAETLTDEGWLCTGDLGEVSRDGFVSVTGRKKDLIITSSGKNITPVNIENALRESRFITEAIVFGDNRPYLVAAVTLDRDETGRIANGPGAESDVATLAADPHVRAAVQKEVDAVNAKLARIEQVKRFAILERDLTQAGGEMTPTLKVKRAAVYAKYAEVFEALYLKEES